MNHAILGEILAKEVRFPQSGIFYSTLILRTPLHFAKHNFEKVPSPVVKSESHKGSYLHFHCYIVWIVGWSIDMLIWTWGIYCNTLHATLVQIYVIPTCLIHMTWMMRYKTILCYKQSLSTFFVLKTYYL